MKICVDCKREFEPPERAPHWTRCLYCTVASPAAMKNAARKLAISKRRRWAGSRSK